MFAPLAVTITPVGLRGGVAARPVGARQTAHTLHAKTCPAAARIPQCGPMPSYPAHGATEATRARPTDPPSLRADDHDDVE